ncbi:two-component sensor histidine kinase [Pseudonocardia asaccharolytica DSM 44247 = NBRC 16224]|uniref:histidine kinase n=1 Tax=Pseudonocardia asaccharolytica DSM 44247 = NBRC 16224 TaxID=1123024 RepID=A0A511D6W3_9PSEU|nr:two-component sensor histidine kinase [Pseudonocardia asaccharolytica DSM 44247 = NBRC 16224]
MVRIVATEAAAVLVPAAAVLLGRPAFGYSILAGLVGCALLPLRRLWPPLGVLGVLWGLVGGLGWPSALVALYALGRRSRRLRDTVAWLVLAGLAAILPVLLMQDLAWSDAAITVAFVALWAGAPVALGLLISTRERLTAGLRDLEAARDAALCARESAARAEERARIGREFHDVVGHHATLIAVGAAALAVSAPDDETRLAAARLRVLARTALAEMRTALGLLDEPAGRPPGVAELDELVARSRVAGMRADLVHDGEPAQLPPSLDRAVYRVVQESLTNAARHAPGAPVRIELGWRDDTRLRVRVHNAGVSRSEPCSTAFPKGGTGLAGLAERVAAVDGELISGPGPDGGFVVQALLPRAGAAAAVGRRDPA